MTEDYFIIQKELLNQLIEVTVRKIGDDYLVVIIGGHKPHIGSVSVAAPCDRLNQPGRTATVSTIIYPGHKDDHIGNRFSESISKYLDKKVTVVCGVHFDEINEDKFKLIIDFFESVLSELLQTL